MSTLRSWHNDEKLQIKLLSFGSNLCDLLVQNFQKWNKLHKNTQKRSENVLLKSHVLLLTMFRKSLFGHSRNGSKILSKILQNVS